MPPLVGFLLSFIIARSQTRAGHMKRTLSKWFVLFLLTWLIFSILSRMKLKPNTNCAEYKNVWTKNTFFDIRAINWVEAEKDHLVAKAWFDEGECETLGGEWLEGILPEGDWLSEHGLTLCSSIHLVFHVAGSIWVHVGNQCLPETENKDYYQQCFKP